jgi:ribosomal protein L7/L12
MQPSVVLVVVIVLAVVVIGVAVARAAGGPSSPAQLPDSLRNQPIDGDVLARIRQLLGEGKKIQAIKELRESRPGMGLKDAKDLVEAIEAGFEPGVGYAAPVGPAVGPGQAPGGEVLARVRQLLGEGKKIQAIKEYRASRPGVGLKEAKETVEAIEAGYEPAAASVAAAPAAAPEPSQVAAAGASDLAKRVRELRESGQETLAIRLVCDETGMGILDAQKFVRSLD